jgi:hypothetical protein
MLPTPARTPLPVRIPGPLLLVVLLAALTLGLLPGPAQAAERTVAGGRLDWGIRSSFLNYVTGPIAQGSWGLSGGAATVGAGQFRFHSAQGGYDPDAGAIRARYSGGVRFYGHRAAGGEYELDLTLSNPTVVISGGTGMLRADIRSKDRDTGQVSDLTDVAFATLDLTGVSLKGGTGVSVSSIPATLTAEGARAFAGFYEAGEPLDPVTFTADSHAPEPEPEPDSEPDPEPSPEDTAGSEERQITAAAVDWGIRRTFREFVTGDIAEGDWQLTGGALDGGALFRFPDGHGDYDPETHAVRASFAGSLHFTGNDLDLRFSAVTVQVAEGIGTLAADVTAGDVTEEAQPLVTFEVPEELAPADGLLLVSEAPATLTEAGAAAFGGLYAPGTAMDPVSLAVALDERAELPALPDLGSEPPPEETRPEPTGPEPEPTDTEPAAAPSDSSSALPLLVTGLAALLVVAAAGYLVLRRTRAHRTATPPAEPAEADADKETPEP